MITSPASDRNARAESSNRKSGPLLPSGRIIFRFPGSDCSNADFRGISPRNTRSSVIHTGLSERFTGNCRRTSSSFRVEPVFWSGSLFFREKTTGMGHKFRHPVHHSLDLRFGEVPDERDQSPGMVKMPVREHDNVQVPQADPHLLRIGKEQPGVSRYRTVSSSRKFQGETRGRVRP